MMQVLPCPGAFSPSLQENRNLQHLPAENNFLLHRLLFRWFADPHGSRALQKATKKSPREMPARHLTA
jgi:hypothetical protein